MPSAPESLTAAHEVASFTCGRPVLDRWLQTRALANQEKGFTVVMVVHEAERVVGYCGLAPTAVLPAALPRTIRTGQPPSPVTCLLLRQLATDLGWAGRGIGTALLAHALRRCVAGAGLIGGRAVVVNALDEEAARFWARWGFVASRDDPLVLFRSIQEVAASLQKVEPIEFSDVSDAFSPSISTLPNRKRMCFSDVARNQSRSSTTGILGKDQMHRSVIVEANEAEVRAALEHILTPAELNELTFEEMEKEKDPFDASERGETVSFLTVILWTGNVVASGVIGGIAYDLLKKVTTELARKFGSTKVK